MAAPAPTARGTPSGIKLEDGFSSKITFAGFPTISFWEKTVKPPGIDGGDKIPQTTMFNTTFETFAAQALKTLTDGSAKVAYDPIVLSTIVGLVNYETTVTITFSDGSTYAFFGYLKSFEPDELQRGTQPEATVTFVATNRDSTGTEQAPVETNVAGT